MGRMARKLAAFMVVIAVGLVTVPTADAQQPPPQPPPEIEVTDEILESFAKAFLIIDQVRVEAEERMRNVQSQEEAQQIQQQANAQMQEAVREQELTPQEYAQIATTVNQDEELQEQLQEIIEELEEDGWPPSL